MELLERERDKHRAEIAKLLDRIQFPHEHQVEPVDPIDYEPPRDAGELAQVGQIVPNYVDVGEHDA